MTHLGPLDPQSIIEASGGWALAIVCLIVFVETGLLIGFVLPGDTLLFTTGVLTFAGAIHVPIALVVAAIAVAALAGDQLGYLIGRRLGPRVFERRAAGLISRPTLDRTNGFFERYGAATVTIARFIAVVRTVSPVAAGTARMPYGRFITFDAIGAALWSLVLVLGGYFLGQIPAVADFVSQYMDLILTGLVVISVASIVITMLRSRRAARREQTG